MHAIELEFFAAAAAAVAVDGGDDGHAIGDGFVGDAEVTDSSLPESAVLGLVYQQD